MKKILILLLVMLTLNSYAGANPLSETKVCNTGINYTFLIKNQSDPFKRIFKVITKQCQGYVSDLSRLAKLDEYSADYLFHQLANERFQSKKGVGEVLAILKKKKCLSSSCKVDYLKSLKTTILNVKKIYEFNSSLILDVKSLSSGLNAEESVLIDNWLLETQEEIDGLMSSVGLDIEKMVNENKY